MKYILTFIFCLSITSLSWFFFMTLPGELPFIAAIISIIVGIYLFLGYFAMAFSGSGEQKEHFHILMISFAFIAGPFLGGYLVTIFKHI